MRGRHLLPETTPQLILAASNLAYTVGGGLYLTAGVIYFTVYKDFTPAQVGTGLAVAGLLALGLGIVIGHLADRHGAKRVYIACLAAQALATAGFLALTNMPTFIVAVTAASAAKAGGLAARSPLIRQYGGDRPQAFRGYLRAISNVGISLGALLAGLAVQSDTDMAYRMMIVGNTICFILACIIVLPLQAVPPYPGSTGHGWVALKDAPYIGVTLMDGIMAVQFKVLTVALPLWIITSSNAPRWLVSATMILNTVIVIVFQVRASRGISSIQSGATAYRRAGIAFLAACILIPASRHTPSWGAVAIILIAVAVHSLGELWHSAGGFEVSFALAPHHATGQYLGVFGLGAGLADAVGPALTIALCITAAPHGWYALGIMFLIAGLITPFFIGQASQSGQHPTAT